MIHVILLWLLLNAGECKNLLRVIEGQNVKEGESVYVVRLEIHITLRTSNMVTTQQQHICTCAALSKTWTLTASHCVESVESVKKMKLKPERTARVAIRYGSVLSNPWRDNTFSDVLLTVKHPGYALQEKNYFWIRNDVGLIKNTPIILSQYGKLNAVDHSSLLGQKALLVGYGITNMTDRGPVTTLELRKPLQVLDVVMKKCEPELSNVLYPAICLAGRCGVSGSMCPGDSGGPLVHTAGIVGINSLGVTADCFVINQKERSKSIGVVTALSPYIDWILSYIQNETRINDNKQSDNFSESD